MIPKILQLTLQYRVKIICIAILNNQTNFFPGINDEALAAIAQHFGQKPLKLAFDGNKISRGKGKKKKVTLIVEVTKNDRLLLQLVKTQLIKEFSVVCFILH